MSKKHALFSFVRVGAYCIRPHSSIRKQRENISISPFLVIRKQMNHRPGLFSIRSASDMFIRGAYAIRPYPDRRKIAMILIRLPHSNLKNAQILIHR